MKKIICGFSILILLALFLAIPGDTQFPVVQDVPIWGNATKLIDTTNEEFGIAHTAGVLQTIINSSALPSGASTEAKQDDSIDQLTLAVTGLTNLLTELQLKADLTETQPVSNASLPLPSGAATSAKQLAANHTVDVQMKTGDSTYQTPRLDPTTHAQNTIDYSHHEIHEGNSYKFDHIQQDSYDLCFKIPAGTKRVHLIVSWLAESKVEIKLFEGREWDASSGTINTTAIFNRDRNSDNTSQIQEDTTGSWVANMAFILNPTNIGAGGNAAGTEIHHWETWSDKKQTVQTRETAEFILKNDEVYVINITSNDGVKDIHILCDWYEHTNR